MKTQTYLAKFGIQVLSILSMGLLGGLMAFLLAQVTGRLGIFLAPGFHFQIVERFFCPPGITSLSANHTQIIATSLSAAANTAVATCVSPDGLVMPGLEREATNAVINLYFALFFVPFFIPGSYLMWRLLNRLYHMLMEESDE